MINSFSDMGFVRYDYTAYERTVPPHTHNHIEYIYIIEGEMTAFINNTEHKCSDGDIFFVNPGELHHTYGYKGTQTYVGYIDIGIIDMFYRDYIPVINHITKELIEDTNEKIDDILKNIERHTPELDILSYNRRDSYEKAIIFSESLKLYSLLAKYFHGNSHNIASPVSSSTYRILTEFINENFMKDITLEDLSKHLNYSKTYTSKIFKELMGTSFKKSITIARLNKASEYLINTNMSINEIAYKCGYNNVRSFYKQFTLINHTNPSAYRINSR